MTTLFWSLLTTQRLPVTVTFFAVIISVPSVPAASSFKGVVLTAFTSPPWNVGRPPRNFPPFARMTSNRQ